MKFGDFRRNFGQFESMGGPAIFANAVGALAIRSNYFEANEQRGEDSAFMSYFAGAQQPRTFARSSDSSESEE